MILNLYIIYLNIKYNEIFNFNKSNLFLCITFLELNACSISKEDNIVMKSKFVFIFF